MNRCIFCNVDSRYLVLMCRGCKRSMPRIPKQFIHIQRGNIVSIRTATDFLELARFVEISYICGKNVVRFNSYSNGNAAYVESTIIECVLHESN